MKTKILKFPLVAVVLGGFLSPAHSQTTVNSDAVGFVNLTITAGTGTAKRNTQLSFPLYSTAVITGQAEGAITSVTSNTIVNTNAGWVAGELSQPSAPCAIQITSGAAEGRIFLIAASSTGGGAVGPVSPNTATSLTISALDTGAGVNLTAIGIQAGDRYRIIEVDTLGSIFGTTNGVSLGIRGGTSLSNSDSISIVQNGVAQNYFYQTNVSPHRWSRVTLGNPSSSNVPILPYHGIVYSRLASNPLTFKAVGTVPVNLRKTLVKNSGSTAFAQYWPVDTTLQSLGIQNLPGWVANSKSTNADTVVLTVGGVQSSFWFDSTNWRRVVLGNPVANTNVIPAGTMILLNKRGTAPGYSVFGTNKPYNF